MREMDVTEIMENMAFDMLQDKDYKSALLKEISLEQQKQQTPEQEAENIRQLFMQFGLPNKD